MDTSNLFERRRAGRQRVGTAVAEGYRLRCVSSAVDRVTSERTHRNFKTLRKRPRPSRGGAKCRLGSGRLPKAAVAPGRAKSQPCCQTAPETERCPSPRPRTTSRQFETDSLGKALKLGKAEGKRRRGWQRMRRLDGTTDSGDVGFSKL